jgi:hypothetical protein
MITGSINMKVYHRLLKQNTKVINDHCETCVTLAMCKNKPKIDILDCALLTGMFYDESRALGYHAEALYERSIMIRIECLNALFWIVRASTRYATIDIINEKKETVDLGARRIDFGPNYGEGFEDDTI